MNKAQYRLRYNLEMAAQADTADILIYGELWTGYMKWTEEDMSARDFDKLLNEAKAQGATRLNIRINSAGGDVNQATAIRAMLMNSGMEEIKISIEGMCASAATLIACLPGAHVTMAEGGEYMIHNPRSGAWGEAKDLEAGARRLRSTEKEAAAIYAGKSGQDEATIRAWMDATTWMGANEAHQRGFVDSVLAGQPVQMTVTPRDMAAMREMYGPVPDSIRETEEAPQAGPGPDENISNAQEAAEDTHNQEREDERNMEISELTMEQLQEGNPALYQQVMQAGAAGERERMQDIDELTPAGEEYAQMAARAKAEGTSAMAFHKEIVKASKKKGQQFLENRRQETAPAAMVTGGSDQENNGKSEKQLLEDHAKEMKDYYAQMAAATTGMF